MAQKTFNVLVTQMVTVTFDTESKPEGLAWEALKALRQPSATHEEFAQGLAIAVTTGEALSRMRLGGQTRLESLAIGESLSISAQPIQTELVGD